MCACLAVLLPLHEKGLILFCLPSAKTRIQAETRTKPQVGMFRLLLAILKNDGIWGLYRGFTATMVNTFSMRT